MNSLEPECLELAAADVIDAATAMQGAALERGAIFSVFEELRFALYAAVAAITAGIGLLVKDNLDRIGPITLMAVLALAAAGCYATALRTAWQDKERSIGGDYLLLLGALIVSADLGYAESQFHWLGSEWQWYLLILAAFHGATGYGLRSRLVLCTSIAALAAWFGIEGRAATLFSAQGSTVSLAIHAIVCAGTLLVWRMANHRLGGPKSFESVFENFAANIGFWGALALCLTPGARLLGLGLLAVLAAASIFKALAQRRGDLCGVRHRLCRVDAVLPGGAGHQVRAWHVASRVGDRGCRSAVAVEFPSQGGGTRMIELLPKPQQERWMSAAARFKVVRNHPWIAQRTGGWSAPSFIARCAFFVMGVAAGGLTGAVFEILLRPAALPAAGVTLLIAAEWLILRKRLFHAGVEEALWTGGLLLLTLHFVSADGELGLAVAIALVLAVAAIRLLNPLLLTLAFAAASIAIDFAGGHRLMGEADVAIPAAIFCYGVGAIALLLARIRFSRPSHDHMLNWLMVIMPLCGFLWLAAQHAPAIRVGTGLASGIFALIGLIAGIRQRSHAPLLACMASLGCVAYQLRDLTTLPLKLKLIVWGSAALVAALGLDRYLRTPRRGITSRPVGEGTGALDLLQWAGAASLSPAAAPRTAPFKGSGGDFSGGGADGRY